MALTLRDAHYYVRSIIGELEQFRWSDAFINFSLNNHAQEFYSAGGLSTQFYNVPVIAGTQEGVLPIELDQVKDVSYFSGQLFKLEYKDWSELQTGAFTGSIPIWYYVKTDSMQTTGMDSSSDITTTNLFPQVPGGANIQQVIGVWPIIATAGEIHVWYSQYHPFMKQPKDISPIPRMFLDGWAAGAIADCLRTEKAYAEADGWDQLFMRRKEDYRIYASTHKQTSGFKTYGVQADPWRTSASSSIILVDQTPSM